MTVAEVDFRARLWRLPAARVKNKHPHNVPLSDLAVSIIEEAIKDAAGSPFVFPCGKGSLSPVAVARTILRANAATQARPRGRFNIGPWSAHDLRRTALSNMGKLGIAPIVRAHVANHRSATRAGVTLGVYDQYDYNSEQVAALSLWADRLAAIIADKAVAEVLPLKQTERGRG
jgi:integrase